MIEIRHERPADCPAVRAVHERAFGGASEAGKALVSLVAVDEGRLLGHIRYYPRFGFSRAADHGLDNEYNARDAFMALELKEGALRRIKGLVRYEPEFGDAGC